MKFCPSCQLEYDDKYEFCHQCGNKLKNKEEHIFCPYCGKKTVIDGEFCPYCGKSLADTKQLKNTSSVGIQKAKPENTVSSYKEDKKPCYDQQQTIQVKKQKKITNKRDNPVKEENKFVKFIIGFIGFVFFLIVYTFLSKGAQEAFSKGYGIYVIVALVVLIPLWLRFKD